MLDFERRLTILNFGGEQIRRVSSLTQGSVMILRCFAVLLFEKQVPQILSGYVTVDLRFQSKGLDSIVNTGLHCNQMQVDYDVF